LERWAQRITRTPPQNRGMNSLASLAIYADEPAAHPPPRYAAGEGSVFSDQAAQNSDPATVFSYTICDRDPIRHYQLV
jgi:hypothetical protein